MRRITGVELQRKTQDFGSVSCAIHTSVDNFSRTFEECSAIKVSRMISDILSMLLACVQYESCTEANVRP